MSDFYDFDEHGLPLKRKEVMPSNFVRMPTCPTCRQAIVSPRYSFVTRRAFMDLQERNYFLQTKAVLEQLMTLVDQHNQVEPPAWPKIEQTKRLRAKVKNIALEILQLPEPPRPGLTALPDVSRILRRILPLEQLETWQARTRALIEVHSHVERILKSRAPLKAVYEAAYVTAYRQEKDKTFKMQKLPEEPEEWCRRQAERRVGMPPPRADTRILIEGTWLVLDIVSVFPLPTIFSHSLRHISSEPSSMISPLVSTINYMPKRRVETMPRSGDSIKSSYFLQLSEIARALSSLLRVHKLFECWSSPYAGFFISASSTSNIAHALLIASPTRPVRKLARSSQTKHKRLWKSLRTMWKQSERCEREFWESKNTSTIPQR